MPTLQIRTTILGPRVAGLPETERPLRRPFPTQAYPLVVDRAAGCHVWDVDGTANSTLHGDCRQRRGHGHRRSSGDTAQAGR